MKNLKKLGKIITRLEQQNIFGGFGIGGWACASDCVADIFCGGDPNCRCLPSPCTADGQEFRQFLCRCVGGEN